MLQGQQKRISQVIGQRSPSCFYEESNDRQMLFYLGPLRRFLGRSLVANGFQKVRQSGETAAGIAVTRARCEHDVTEQ